MIKETTEASFSEYDDKKNFNASLSKQFAALKEKILTELDKDKSIKDRKLQTCNLNKIYYYIPTIELLPTLVSEESSEEEQSLDIDSSFVSQDIEMEDDIKDGLTEKIRQMMQSKKSQNDLMFEAEKKAE